VTTIAISTPIDSPPDSMKPSERFSAARMYVSMKMTRPTHRGAAEQREKQHHLLDGVLLRAEGTFKRRLAGYRRCLDAVFAAGLPHAQSRPGIDGERSDERGYGQR
jgi:hypothetical protein